MSGLGSSPAGAGAAGFNVIDDAPATATSALDALFYTVLARDIPVDADGNYVTCHWVDSEVLIRLGIRLGALSSVPEAGSLLADLPIDDEDVMTAEADRRVRLALEDLIAAGHVEVVEVTASSPVSGRARVFVAYRNLRLPNAKVADTLRKRTFG